MHPVYFLVQLYRRVIRMFVVSFASLRHAEIISETVRLRWYF